MSSVKKIFVGFSSRSLSSILISKILRIRHPSWVKNNNWFGDSSLNKCLQVTCLSEKMKRLKRDHLAYCDVSKLSHGPIFFKLKIDCSCNKCKKIRTDNCNQCPFFDERLTFFPRETRTYKINFQSLFEVSERCTSLFVIDF